MKVTLKSGTVEVVYLATSNEVAIVFDAELAGFRVRAIMATPEARALRGELERALVDAELAGAEGPL